MADIRRRPGDPGREGRAVVGPDTIAKTSPVGTDLRGSEVAGPEHPYLNATALSVTEPAWTDRRRTGGTGGQRLYERSTYVSEFAAIFSLFLQVPSRCISIDGPKGSGRTALFNAACTTAARSGNLVLGATGGDVEKRTPFAVLSRLIELGSARLAGPDATAEQRAAVEALTGVSEGAHLDPTVVSPLFYSFLMALRQLGPVLLGVDDADLADRETLAVLQYVVRRLGNQQVWILVTTRPLYPGVGLRPVDQLVAEPGARHLTLEPLSAESVGEILAEYFGEDPDEGFVAACHQVTRGWPFLLIALLSALGHKRIRPTAQMVGSIALVQVPRITKVVLGQLTQLPVAAADLLQACAILGDVADPTVARRLVKIDALAAERAADAAEQMELLAPGRPLSFVAPLVRYAIYHDIPTGRRSQLHAQAASLLAEVGASESVIAEHLLKTEPAGDVEMARQLQGIARTLITEGGTDLALRCLHRCLAEPPPVEQRASVYLDLASAELQKGLPSAFTKFERAVELGEEDDSQVVKVASQLLRGRQEIPQLRSQIATAMELVADRLDNVDRGLRIEFLLALAATADDLAQRRASLDELKGLLAEPGPRTSIVEAAELFVRVDELSRGFNATVSGLASLVDAKQLEGADPLVSKVHALACYSLICADQLPAADVVLRLANADARSGPDTAVLTALAALAQGALGEAEHAALRAGALHADMKRRGSFPMLGLVEGLVQQGRIDDALAAIGSVLRPEDVDDPILRLATRMERGRLHAALGCWHDALEEFLTAGEESAAAGVVNPAMAPWRAEAAVALATLGRGEEARRLAEEHLTLAQSFGAVRSIGLGLRAVAAASPDPIERCKLLAEAAELLEGSTARLDAARALVELGTALVDAKSKDEAREMLERGAHLASLCGAQALVEAARTQLHAAGARPRSAWAPRARLAHPCRASCGSPGCRRQEQPADRCRAVRHGEDCRRPSGEGLPQAGCPLPPISGRRTDRCHQSGRVPASRLSVPNRSGRWPPPGRSRLRRCAGLRKIDDLHPEVAAVQKMLARLLRRPRRVANRPVPWTSDSPW